MSDKITPVITIDGPCGTGKGTVSAWLAEKLGWHWLDSGSIYRAMAWVVLQASDPEPAQADIVEKIKQASITVGSTLRDGVSLPWAKVAGRDLGDAIRTEACSQMASKVASIPELRAIVLDYQRDFAKPPGLVTDGRDMGTVVFPGAVLKIFLTATPIVRAERRQKQLQKRGVSVTLASVLEEIEQRDLRDRTRKIAPAVAASDALEIDTSQLSVQEVFQEVWHEIERRELHLHSSF